MNFLLRRRWAGALLFLVPRHDYWHPFLPPNLDDDITGDRVYYLDFSAKCPHPGPFDEAGIPFTRYGDPIGLQHYAIDICQYALGHHQQWLKTSQLRHREIFLRQARWLQIALQVRRDLPDTPALWMAGFNWGRLRAPWPSGMAQGQGISVLVRAHAMSGDPTFLDAARAALAGLRLSLSQGGTTRYDEGLPFFEELPTPEPSRILNGAIFALWGVHDLWRVTGDPAIGAFYNDGVRNLVAFLPRYDMGYWTRYDLEAGSPHPSSAFYQELHVNQLRVMHHLTGIDDFQKYALRWQKQLESLSDRMRALAAKVLS